MYVGCPVSKWWFYYLKKCVFNDILHTIRECNKNVAVNKFRFKCCLCEIVFCLKTSEPKENKQTNKQTNKRTCGVYSKNLSVG